MELVTNEYLLERLKTQFGDAIISAELPYNLLTLVIDPIRILDMLKWLNADEILKFRFLTDICGSHFPDFKDNELCVIYHVQSMENNVRLRLKAFLPISKPEIASVTSLYSSANWMERETYDYYGVIFTGHPNLKRILNVDEMDYFPLRKEYPLEDGTRRDKEDQYFGR
ncbi:MAG: NADH-quinone oxidoreductase subunit C [Saprospiraceae bacterium]